MPATIIGTPVPINWGNGITNPGAETITVPADCTAVYMFWQYFANSDGSGLLSTTLAAAAPSQSAELPIVDATDESATGVAVWYNPPTGSQSLDLEWDANPVYGPTCVVVYVKDGDLSAWRDVKTDGATASNNATVTLTTQSGDLLLRFDARYDVALAAPSLSSGWTDGQTSSAGQYAARLSYKSASGTSEVLDSENDSYSSIVAVAIPGVDTTPDAFTFTDQTEVALSTTRTSNTITVSGIGAAATVTVSGGEWQKNSGAWSSDSGTVVNGDTVAVRHTASSTQGATVNTTLTIGGVSDTFSSTTIAAPSFRAVSTASFNGTGSLVGGRPTGTTDGDGLLAFVITRPPTQDVYGTLTPPSGTDWVEELQINPPSPGRVRVYVYSKIADSEPTSWTWDWTLSHQAYVIVLAYQNANVADLIDQITAQLNATVDGTCETPAVTPTSIPGRLVSFYLHGDGITTGYFEAGATLANGTERVELRDDAVGGRLIMVVGDEAYSALSQIPSRVSTADYGSSSSIGISILLRDAGYVPAGGLLLLQDFFAAPGIALRI